MSMGRFGSFVAISLALIPAWVGAACALPGGIGPGPAVDSRTLDGFYLGGDVCLYDPRSVVRDDVPRFRGSRVAEDVPTLYYVNGANGSPLITALNLAALAERSQIAILGIFYAGDGLAAVVDALPAVPSGPAVEALEQLIADHLARQEPLHIRGGSAGTVVISEAIHATRNRLARETRLRGDWTAPLDLLRVETQGALARDFPDGPRYIHYDAKFDPVTKIGVAGPVAHPGARAVVAHFDADRPPSARVQAAASLAQSARSVGTVRPAGADEAALSIAIKAKGLGIEKPLETQQFIAEMSLAALLPGSGGAGVPDALKDALAFLSNAFLAVHGAQTYDPYRRPFGDLFGVDLPALREVRKLTLETPPSLSEGL